jgi:aspartyl-tRNA(Asn)/glutamyl-tRNA(Gln) amidotransferase subunit B
MRSKEDAPDYRYFPDPDLVELQIGQELLDRIAGDMPELPARKVSRVTSDYGLSRNDALVLTKDRDIANFFEQAATSCTDRSRLAKWIMKDLFKLLNDAQVPVAKCLVSPEKLATLVNLIAGGDITDRMARTVLQQIFETGKSPESIIEEKGLRPITDRGLLERALEEVIAENPDVLGKIKEGNTKPVEFLMGQVMKKTRGRADPAEVKDLIRERLGGRR